ncbi:DUF2812 domain-containing protein [Clostridium perfringens]|nr:DUF2812 domain-containing protein [Clostridium perfringens]
MINKDKKSKYLVFSAYECTAIEEYLEEMAQKGWFLESISGSRFRFIKIEPKNLKYSVEPVSQVSTLDTPDSNTALEYREYCEAAGWKYICEKGKLQIFYSEENSDLLPIHTNENEKFKSVFKSSLFEIALKLLLVFLLSLNIYNSLFNGNISFILTSNLGLLSVILLLILIVINTAEVISFIIWSIKAKIAINKGSFIPYNTLKQFKRKNLITKAINISVIFFLLIILLIDRNNFSDVSTSILLATLMILIIFIVDRLTKKFLQKTKYSKKVNILISCVSIVFSFFLIMFVSINAIMGFAGDGFIGETDLSKSNLPLTLNDFELSNKKSNDLYISEDISIMAKEIYYSDSIDNNRLNYSLFESDYGFIIDAMEKSSIKFETRFEKEHNPNFVVKEPIIIDGIKIYSFDDNIKSYIFVSNNKVLNINNSLENVSTEKFINLVCNKIFNKDINISNN